MSCVLALGLSFPGAPGIASAQDSGKPIVQIDATIQRTIVPLADLSRPKAPIRNIRMSRQMASQPGSLTEIDTRYEWLGTGLWGAVSVMRMSTGSTAQQTISLCGVFDLLLGQDNQVSLDQVIVVPLGKIFVPFGMKSDFSSAALGRMTNLVVDPSSACIPKAGSGFEFETRIETQLSSSGIFGSTRTVPSELKGRCELSGSLPGSALHPRIRGDYLLMTCTAKNQAGASITRRHAFIVESALAVPLETSTKEVQYRYSITDVQYAD